METMDDDKYMWRCLLLAQKGKGSVSPNPMVGAVVVHNNKIIGEGFHRQYGQAHAEVNAINSVKDKSLLSESTIYVSLEPCAHHGKTPPCTQLIIDHHIPNVVIGTLDPYPKVAGKGLKILQESGIDVKVGILEKELLALNKEFLKSQIKTEPYIYLKWAQTIDGFIDKERVLSDKPQPTIISNSFTKMLVHKFRSEVDAIMIGTNTAIKDNPSLTTRSWYGKSPIRIILDRTGRIPHHYKLFNNEVQTLIFTESVSTRLVKEKTEWIPLIFGENMISELLQKLHDRKINSLLVEGGGLLLQTFLSHKNWDEAFVEIADKRFGNGVKAPSIEGELVKEQRFDNSKQLHIRRFETYNFL